jgi:hypothetical protein
MFESIKKALGNPRIVGMAPKCVRNIMFEFWYDDTGDQYDADAQNQAMEKLLGGGFYGPGLILERRNDNETMCGDDYGDILAKWNNKTRVYEYLCTLLGVKKHRTPEERAQRAQFLLGCMETLDALKSNVEEYQKTVENRLHQFHEQVQDIEKNVYRTPQQCTQLLEWMESLDVLKMNVEEYEKTVDKTLHQFNERVQDMEKKYLNESYNEDSSKQPASQKVHGDI